MVCCDSLHARYSFPSTARLLFVSTRMERMLFLP